MITKLRTAITASIFILLMAGNIYADGFIVIHSPPRPRPRPSNPFPLEVKYHHVDVKIKGQTSITFIDQEFYNPSSRRLEGYYIFPVPKGAVINKFSMFIDGKEVGAELLGPRTRYCDAIYELPYP